METKSIAIPIKFRKYLIRSVKSRYDLLENDTSYVDSEAHNKNCNLLFELLNELQNDSNCCDGRCGEATKGVELNEATQIDIVSKGEILHSFEVKSENN